MHDLLIPFGINRQSGELVEPEDAAKGRACNCLCPGCEAPLLARHSEIKRDHFAHDTRHPDAKPEHECPFNSAAAIAMMARYLAPGLVGKSFQTPDYLMTILWSCCNVSDYVHIAPNRQITIESVTTGFRACNHSFDLALGMGGHYLLVDFAYKGKVSPTIDNHKLMEMKAGVITLYLGSFDVRRFKSDTALRFSDAVEAFVLTEADRTWEFHPRQVRLQHEHEATHRCQPPSQYSPRSRWQADPAKATRWQAAHHPTASPRSYHCIQCGSNLTVNATEHNSCPICQTHLYLRPSNT